MTPYHLAGFVLSLVLCASVATAQTPQQPPAMASIDKPRPGETQELRLKDGTRAYGRVERIDDGFVTFRTTSGALIEVPHANVIHVRVVDGRVIDGEFWSADPNPTRLFFAPTARALKRGEGYFGVYEILLPFVQVGITDRISVGAGTPLVFGGGSEHPFWVTPKAQLLSRGNTDAAVGIMHFLNVGDGSFGIAYSVVTYGSDDSAITGGVGYAYERYDGNGDGSVILMVGGEHRVSRGVKLISENYLWRGGGFVTAGVRWMGERLSTDLGLAAPLGTDVFVFPMVNFVWKFASH